jgi:hypothetical protein
LTSVSGTLRSCAPSTMVALAVVLGFILVQIAQPMVSVLVNFGSKEKSQCSSENARVLTGVDSDRFPKLNQTFQESLGLVLALHNNVSAAIRHTCHAPRQPYGSPNSPYLTYHLHRLSPESKVLTAFCVENRYQPGFRNASQSDDPRY